MALGSLGLEHRPLVPVEVQPAQRVEDLLDVLGCRSLAIGIFDPQHERPGSPSGPYAWPRASNQLYKAVRAPPMCSAPVGDGAKRTRMTYRIAC